VFQEFKNAMSALRFQELAVKRVSPEAAGAVAITFAIPEAERERFAFEPGQFLTLRATIDGQDVRRSYSISSPRSRLRQGGRAGGRHPPGRRRRVSPTGRPARSRPATPSR
jgi:hypothetical protein